ncbi:1,2-phenylacetyl-CoA epoxidase subunit PaaC [Chitinasiproducens palmae]|uniref:Ring-1,2-phenylacetyl-CoA epoxidase subunit PaaC n=1 Tax=Chitinasiproducens palmae TaxID=1770053 RepID=A0A1H2PNU7_9BURK|nr:1,2-phenylacetyl-CoA epoxidase subunit PaaC [Chitinasiproducens palmae]SDV48343.1 ring-1,2-phenylacetyl-CoA epoxidase subunit PaaC [Chitinasiproducens palmae]
MTTQSHLTYVLRLADTALILGQRNSEWCGHGPALEEDIALANVSLDLIGQARMLYGHAAKLEHALTGVAKSEDDYAYWRDEMAFLNYTMVELPHHASLSGTAAANRDYAVTIVRNFLYAALMAEIWPALETSTDTELAGIAAKASKETRYHFAHSRDWLVRLGDGTEESHRRTQAALDQLMPYTNEFFAGDAVDDEMAAEGIAPALAPIKEAWQRVVALAAEEATLTLPAAGARLTTGKRGLHSEHMGFLLAEMQSLARQHPGASW